MLKSNMFAEGGVMQEGGTVDPVSGNEVPVGSLKEEVRDDIDAKLSEGEFVLPADVVRYIGLETLMKLRDKAKAGLRKMEEIGQMGNAEEVPNAEALHGEEDEMDDDTFSSEIDNIIGEVDAESMGGERKFAAGGFAQPGTDYLAKYNIPRSSISNPALDVRAYKNAEGRLMYITFFNGKPSTPIPEGFTYVGTGQQVLTTKPEEDKKPDTPADTTATGTPISDGGAGGDGAVGTTSGATGTSSTDADGLATASTVSPTAVAVGLTGAALAMGVPAVASPTGMVTGMVTNAINSISHSIAAAANVAATGSPAAVDSHSQVSDTAPTATTGPSGTGGAAASAAADAAAAAAAVGHSAEAQGAASQAAADATVSGADAAAAAAAGAAAAAAADNGDAAEGGNTAANAAAAAADASTTGDSSSTSGDGVSGIGADGIGFAKGGLVSKRKSSPKSTKQKGLASRK